MNIKIDINNKALVIHINRLEKLRKSALPNAIRNTLNSLAFDVKQNTMPVSSSKHFIKRKPNFFKANSKVFMAQGYSITNMKSVVAFIPSSAEYNNLAVEELQQQETAGTIPNRTFIPLNQARSGGAHAGQVLPSNRLRAIKKVIDAAKSQGRNKKEKFIRAALYAGKRGLVIGNIGKQKLYRINSIRKDKKTNRTIISATMIYSYDKGRSVKIKKSRSFMREASTITYRKAGKFFQREALRQTNRVFK